MTCKGTCEYRTYEFFVDGDKTKTESSPADAPKLDPPEHYTIVNAYFEKILNKRCKECADGCECVPAELTDLTAFKQLALPGPIVATTGTGANTQTYTITGSVRIRSRYGKGVCTEKFDDTVQPKSEPKGRVFKVEPKFEPKPGTADCQCFCEQQAYKIRVTDGTHVTQGKKVPPLDSSKRDSILEEKLKAQYEKDYSSETVTACNGDCDCLLGPVAIHGQERIVKISTPINFFLPDKNNPQVEHKYEITGEFSVQPLIYKGVCVPHALVLKTG